MADEPFTPPPPSASKRAWATCHGLIRGLSFSRVQAVVGLLAGLVSVAGAVFSVVQFAWRSNTGELVTIVQAADSGRNIADARIEVLTTENAMVTTLMPDATGRAKQELTEGVYVVRVSHPRYAAETRRIHVMPRQTTEIRANLRAAASSSIDRAVNKSVSAVRKALRF